MLRGIQVCVFDAYGTLFDVHSPVARLQARLGSEAQRLSGLWRRKQLEYSWLRSLMGRYEDFSVVTRDALEYACQVCGVTDPGLKQALLEGYDNLACYPEVPECLRRIRASGRRVAILSNGEPARLRAAVDSAGLHDLIDATLSVHELSIYKPAPRVYQLALDRLSLAQPAAVAFQSSNAWDVAGAACFGFQVVWINRFAQPPEGLPGRPKAEIRDLSTLPDLLAAD